MLKRGEWREGKFYPDNTPVEVPLKFRNNGGDPLHVLVARAMADISRNAEREGRESILEANDFSVREDGEEFGDISKHSFTEMEEEHMLSGVRGLRDDPDIRESGDGGTSVQQRGKGADHASVGDGGDKSGKAKQSSNGGRGGAGGEAPRGGNESAGDED